MDVDEMIFFCVEKSPPHLAEAFVIDKFAEDVGMAELRHGLDVYKRCKETGIWQTRTAEPKNISLPKWYKPNTGN
jgi:hypothetical protein